MSIIVQKFGGTSVANPERIQAAANIAIKTFNQGHQVVIVVSAMSGETNKLIKLCEEMMPSPELREYDSIVSTGEQVTSGLMSLSLINLGFKAKSYSGHQVKIETDNAHSKARILNIEDTNLKKDLKNGFIAVVAGFQGVDKEGNITTLGRGGSDTTAVALAAALKAEECQIYTDVDGIYTTDPRVVPEAKKIKSINFEEMLEMASLGSKVLQTRSVEFAGKYKVKLRVLSSFSPNNEGTEINFEEKKNMEDPIISGIAFNRDEAEVNILGVPDMPGIAYQILGPIAEAKIDVDVIIQNLGQDGLTDFTFTVQKNDLKKTLKILNEKVKDHIKAREVKGDDKIAKLSIIGVGMRSHVGVASKMFRTLAEEGVNISTISTSEIKISVILEEKSLDKAVNALHKAFDLDKI
ncbi:aspartate kinase [Methylophilaceae bacterium]|jgi:aspartate kinase|nr:aspartate kinase [Methylophilaceae bacterium]MDG1095231.1 aspartate kinase [Methylophilaceae bacterium]